MEEFLVLEPDRVSFTSTDIHRILGRIFDGTRSAVTTNAHPGSPGPSFVGTASEERAC
jgi:hypothetical protein